MRPRSSSSLRNLVSAAALFGAASFAAADGNAIFDSFNEGFFAPEISDGGIDFYDFDNRLDPVPNFVIEWADATLSGQEGFSSPNCLGFGGWSPGEHAAFGRCGSFKMSTGQLETSATVHLFTFFADNGNTVTLEALHHDAVVASDTVDIGQQFGLEHFELSVSGVEFDELRVIGLGPSNDGCFFGLVDNIEIGSGSSGPELTVDATCPDGGPIAVSWTGATPDGTVALLFARGTGNVVIPPGNPCAGTQLGLNNQQLQVAFQGGAGPDGSRTLNSNAPAAACGGAMQLLDVALCSTSNVATVN